MKLTNIIKEMFAATAVRAPESVVSTIMTAARAKTAKKPFAIKLRSFAFSTRGIFAAGLAAVILTIGLVNLEQKPAKEEIMAMYTDFSYQMDFFEDDASALLFDLQNVNI